MRHRFPEYPVASSPLAYLSGRTATVGHHWVRLPTVEGRVFGDPPSMDLAAPILTVVPGARGRVLAALVRQVGAASGREVAVQAGASPATTSRVLAELSASGIVEREVHGTAHAYRLNDAHVFAPAIRALAQAQPELARLVEDATRRWTTPPVGGWVLLGLAGAPPDLVRVVLVPPDSLDAGAWARDLVALEDRVHRATGNPARVAVETPGSLRELAGRRSLLTRELRTRAAAFGRVGGLLRPPPAGQQ